MRWPLGGRRRGRPVLPTRHPAPPAAPTTRVLPPQRGAAEPGPWPAAGQTAAAPPPPPRIPAPPPAAPPPPTRPAPVAAPVAPPPPPTPAPQPAAPPPTGSSNGPTAQVAGDERPVTLRDVRSLRRWLAVTAVWAVAATAIAVLAYLAANDDDEQRIADTGAQARAIQRRLNTQVRNLQSQLDDASSSEQLQGFETRLRALGRVFKRQDRLLVNFDGQLKTTRERLDALEEAPPAADNTTTPP